MPSYPPRLNTSSGIPFTWTGVYPTPLLNGISAAAEWIDPLILWKGELAMQCECTRNCTCEVEQQKNLERNEKCYYAEACANGHPRGQGCGHQGCNC